MSGLSTREQIVEAADQLFYEQGFEHTSFSEIAEVVQISRGNFYHHFKTKDDILAAVIDRRRSDTRVMLDEWAAGNATPVEAIRNFIQILIENQTKIMAFGCPVGTLSAELSKLNHAAKPQATAIFELFHSWLVEQFLALGRRHEAEELASHLLARSQGVAVLATAFQDADFVVREVDQMCAWADRMADGQDFEPGA